MTAMDELAHVSALPELDELWRLSHGDPRICVAVLDGPVNVNHPCFSGADITPLSTLVNEEVDQHAAARHGTHVASLIFGQHGGPIRGIAPRCRGLSVPVFRDGIRGSIAPCSQLDLARAMLQAVEQGAHVINISGGELAASDAAHPLLADAVRQCVDRGVLIIAAAGNDACGRPQIPGAMPSVLSVRAIDNSGSSTPCSRLQESDQHRGVLAPGDEIWGASPDGGTTAASGSSFSTAIVSGVAAVLLSIQLKTGQQPDPDAVRQAILRSAWNSPFSDQDSGRLAAGQLNINGALKLITEGVHNMSESTVVAENGHRQATENGGLGLRTLPIPDLGGRAEALGNGAGESAIATQSPVLGNPKASSGKQESAEPQVKSGGCGCGCSGSTQLVYALGQLGYDFGTEARRDSIMQHMGRGMNPHDPLQLLAYLKENPWDATSIIWTLSLEATPIYAVKPGGPFAREMCERLCSFVGQQIHEGVERVSIPGRIAGKATLLNGQVVPAIAPELRGMYSWTTSALVEAVCGSVPKSSRNGSRAHTKKVQAVGNFLERVYHESRNLGITAQERAINYAASNALNIERVYEAAMKEDMDLEGIEVERSPVCRMDSDCWDVKLLFFFPERQVQTVRKAYRFTVDVSDVVPVMVGKMRSWFVR